MKRLLLAVSLMTVVLAGSSLVWAGCPSGTTLKKQGGVANANGETISTNGPIDVRAISWQCTGTACVFGLYDSDMDGADSTAESAVVFEAGAVASGGNFIPANGFWDQPLTFSDGIGAQTGANVVGIMVYTCQQI